jgi:dihydrofolate reductase
MRKLVLLAHISLDGFVAGVRGELDDFDPGEENLQFVCSLTEQADAALFGRISYELLNKHWPDAKNSPNASKGTIAYSNWYNSAEKIVISQTMTAESSNNTIIIRDNIPDEINKIKNKPGKDILIFGSPAVSQLLMQHDLIDSYWIFVNPIIFGKGIPLFTDMENKIKLKLVKTKQFSNGEFGLNYSVNAK